MSKMGGWEGHEKDSLSLQQKIKGLMFFTKGLSIVKEQIVKW